MKNDIVIYYSLNPELDQTKYPSSDIWYLDDRTTPDYIRHLQQQAEVAFNKFIKEYEKDESTNQNKIYITKPSK